MRARSISGSGSDRLWIMGRRAAHCDHSRAIDTAGTGGVDPSILSLGRPRSDEADATLPVLAGGGIL